MHTKFWSLCFVCSIRGALNGILETTINFGFIVSFLLGSYLTIWEQAKVYLIVPSIAAVLLFFLPESPVFLAKNGKEQVNDPPIKQFSQLNVCYSPNHSHSTESKNIARILQRIWNWKARKHWTWDNIKCRSAKQRCYVKVKTNNEWLQWASPMHLI